MAVTFGATMREPINRRRLLAFGAAIPGGLTMDFTVRSQAHAQAAQATHASRAPSSRRLEPLRSVDAGVLSISYYEEGPAEGSVVVLLHGFPYDIHSYVDVVPMLASKGCRVIVPY